MTQPQSLAALRGNRPAPTEQKPAMGMREIAQLDRKAQFPAMIENFKSQLQAALPKHLSADRMSRIALTCFRSNPALAECEPASVFAAVVQASQLGLEPGLLGQCYLIPFNKKVKRNGREEWVKECQLIPGYQGLVDLARRSGRVVSLEAHVVYENDKFDLSFGLTPKLDHTPCLDGDPGQARLAYAVARLTDGGTHVEVMTKAQIEAIRDRSQNVQNAKKWKKTTPWDTDPEQMWIKTVLRRICKFLPKSVEMATALQLDDAATRAYGQGLTLHDAIEGTWQPVALEHEGDDEAPDEEPAATGGEPADSQPQAAAGGAQPEQGGLLE